jgi:glycine/D-amino acid oxidase-like deaminating enzyme
MLTVNRNHSRVLVIGAGIIGLVSAYHLRAAGFQVSILDAGPDPTSLPRPTERLGATFRGGNARHISVTETAPHASSARTGLITLPTAVAGWFAKSSPIISHSEHAWMADFEALTTNMDLHARYTRAVVEINALGKSGWQTLLHDRPDLFANAGLESPLTILYPTLPAMEAEVPFDRQFDPACAVVSASELCARYPGLTPAFTAGHLVGGLVIDGYALNAITFCTNLIEDLKDRVAFTWGRRATGISRDKDGGILGIIADEGELLLADHYVIASGALDRHLLHNMPLAGRIMGVAGCWITIPRHSLPGALKIYAPDPTSYINITADNDRLLISGGYGFIGDEDIDPESPGILALFDRLEAIISRVFPEQYTMARQANLLDRRVCVRPMTATGLPIFEILPCIGGGSLIITGGNSAGGFTQAPVVASAVLHALTYGTMPQMAALCIPAMLS